MKKNNFLVRYRAFFLFTTLFSGALFSCTESDKDLVKPQTITDIILANEQFSMLRQIIAGAEMGDDFRSNNITLFAPNNAAFQRSNVSASQILALPKDSIKWFLNNHVVDNIKATTNLKTENLNAVNKQVLRIVKSADSTITVNDAAIVIKDINAANGLIQVVDSVLVRR